MVMSVTPTVCVTVADWLALGTRTLGGCRGAATAQAASAHKGGGASDESLCRGFIWSFSSLIGRAAVSGGGQGPRASAARAGVRIVGAATVSCVSANGIKKQRENSCAR